jgi:hypothetical protein
MDFGCTIVQLNSSLSITYKDYQASIYLAPDIHFMVLQYKLFPLHVFLSFFGNHTAITKSQDKNCNPRMILCLLLENDFSWYSN